MTVVGRILHRASQRRAAPWSPALLPSSVGYYAPNRVGLADGATIASLAALGGGGPTLTGTAVTVDAAASLRGRPGAKFLAASTSKLTASTGGVASGAHTIAVIARLEAIPSAVTAVAYLGQQYPAALSAIGASGSGNGNSWWAGHTGSLDPRTGTQDTQPHLMIKRYDGAGHVDVWIDGQHILRASATTPAIGPGITLGGPWAVGFDGDKHLWAATFSSAAIDLATLSQIEAWAHREAGIFRLILDGDSIGFGYGAPTHGDPRSLLAGWTGANTTAAVGAAYMPSCGLSLNIAFTGTTSTEILARQAANVVSLLPGSDTSWVRGAGIPVWIVLSSGTNDLNQANTGNHLAVTATAIANLGAYIAAAHAAGAKVAYLGCLSDPNGIQPAFYEADRQAINAAGHALADAYLDVDSLGTIPRQADGFHPVSNAGIAGLARTALASAMGL